MKKFLIELILIMTVFCAKCVEATPSLDLKLDAPAVLTLNGNQVKVDGKFEKDATGITAMGIGKNCGLKIPAATIFGTNGAITFSLRFQNPKPENALLNRHVLTVRSEADQFIGFYILLNYQRLFFGFMTKDTTTIKSREDLVPGKWYRVACTWDGANIKYYLDGELQGELAQPFVPVFPSYSCLWLGPYSDDWMTVKPWNEDSCFLSNLKVWKRPLSAAEIAGDAGKKLENLEQKYPAYLSVPMVSQPPQINGKLDDPAWRQAASFVSLADSKAPADSLTYENNRPLFVHDGKNLYAAFQTIFPCGVKLLKGDIREQTEPEVWGDESFELYIDVEGKLYRFAGNAAGGYCESLNSSSDFNGNWKYASTLACRIDNREHWQGEIAIPFATLGIANPVGKELKINFCRTWRCFDRLGATSLAIGQGQYDARNSFASLKISDSGNACLVREIKSPNFGTFEETVQLTTPLGGKFNYYVGMLSSESPGAPFTLVNQVIDCKAGESKQMIFNEKITNSSCDRLLFKVTGEQGNLLLQQMVPFKLSDDFIEVVPVFGRAQVLLKPRYIALKSKLGSRTAQAEIIAPDGKKIYTGGITSDAEMTVVFDRKNPVGNYRALVITCDGKDTILTEKTFYYPGIGPWESMPEVTEVLPPFEPVKTITDSNRLIVQLWGRTYEFKNSLLPTAITSQKQAMLAFPAELEVNGQPVIATSFKVGKITPARVDFTAAANNSLCNLEQTSFLEYDGVLFNRISLTAKKELNGVKLVLPIPDSMAKFMHATMAGFGNGSRINVALNKEISIKFNPVVWVGEYEHGLSFFAESAAEWKTMPARPIRIFSSGNQKFLEMTFATKVAAGEKLQLDFGLIATPVRPLPANYPLDTFNHYFGTHLNQAPPKAPVTYAAIAPFVDGAGFYDLPLNEKNPELWKLLVSKYEYVQKNHGITAPYIAALLTPGEYPEVAATVKEWEVSPSAHITYTRDGKTYPWYLECAASDANKYCVWRFAELLKKIPLKGIYFDFGACGICNNHLHGCNDRYPLMAMREFYRRTAAAFVHAGVKDYVIVIHNSETVQVPVITHVTHFFNGEGLRQDSSSTFHNGKDILDTYTQLDFASEHSSLPWGVTSSIYLPTDPLRPEFGGGKEDQELYRFRMTKAGFAGALIHNTIPSPARMHHGLYDKLVRIYDEFGVPNAEFLPYWRNGDWVKVLNGKDIYVSLYRSKDKPEILAVISHLSKEHSDQAVTIEFNPAKFGFKKFSSAREMLSGDDPDYARLYAETNRDRMPVKLGDFGVSDCRLDGNLLKLKLKFHSVAIVKLNAEK